MPCPSVGVHWSPETVVAGVSILLKAVRRALRALAAAPAFSIAAVMRSGNDPVALTGAVKHQIQELNPDLPLYNVSTMQDRLNNSLARRRFTMLVLGIFTLISLGLAVIGIYGLVTYMVGQGSGEVASAWRLGLRQPTL